ncbi:MAG: type VI secretion protein ImpB [Maricaulaceae bacterium]
MQHPTEIETLYIDFDAFFANVERQLDASLRGRPVGITALSSEYSALITRCYAAKAAGIKRGMRAMDARDICPNIAILEARPDVYVDIHNQILDEVNRHVPITKVWSIDEVECRLIGSERRNAQDIAKRIRAGLARRIGPFITPSIGLGPNQFLAKVAAEMEKPNGLTILHPDILPGPLLELRLTDLPGISSNMESRLHAAGIMSVFDLWNIGAKHARKIWNNVEGERLWAQLHGQRTERPPTQKRMFGHSRVLSGEFKDPRRAIDCLHLLTVKAAFRLRRAGFLAGALSISIRTNEAPRWHGERRFAPVADDFTFVRHMRDLYKEGLNTLGQPHRLKSTSVMLHGLIQSQDLAYDMFETAELSSKQETYDTLMQVIDGLNMKHGQALVHVGTRAKLPGGYAGAKIAFGRVPDKEDFY